MCAGNHNTKQCKKTKKRCVNCLHKIEIYNDKIIKADHEALDRKCPSYLKKVEEKQRRKIQNVEQLKESKDIFLRSNARSLIAHKDEIEAQIMDYYKPAIVVLTETRITEDIEDNEINIKGYKVRRYSAESRNTGGVVIYVRDEIKIREVKSRKLPGNYWSITIWIKEEIYIYWIDN